MRVYTVGVIGAVCLGEILCGCNRHPNHRTDSAEQDRIVEFQSSDAEMNAAIADARRTINDFLKVLASPKSDQQNFSVKAPYPTKSHPGQEHIWISNLSFDGKLLHGNVNDEPGDIADLKNGDRVSISPSQISDWMYLEDGKIVGGFTIRVIRNHMSAGEAADFDQHFRFKK
jgi:uncharacterized protein YegJ (DUF2314 family)